ncbi:Mobile element protein, partial [hydrothermal vent metagenome]
KREQEIKKAYKDYIVLIQKYINKIKETLNISVVATSISAVYLVIITENLKYANHQINLIKRRIFNNEKIPHKDKIFSIFQPHTEWINKGKAGVPVELGLRVCIVEDASGYILNHMVMENETDSEIVVSLIKHTQKLYPSFMACSFDKGFHSPSNQAQLKEIMDDVIMPKKGRCNKQESQREGSKEFKTAKRKHSAVESGINALEVHGLDKCLDHGLYGFKRYIAMAVVARNVQKLGSQIIAKELSKIKRQERRRRLAA